VSDRRDQPADRNEVALRAHDHQPGRSRAGVPAHRRARRDRDIEAVRRVKNQRLAAVGYVWAFSALSASPGARTHYDRRRTAGDRHTAAQRNLFNRMLGCLHHCLETRTTYNENIAFPPAPTSPKEVAA
jgi:hypothetical protein